MQTPVRLTNNPRAAILAGLGSLWRPDFCTIVECDYVRSLRVQTNRGREVFFYINKQTGDGCVALWLWEPSPGETFGVKTDLESVPGGVPGQGGVPPSVEYMKERLAVGQEDDILRKITEREAEEKQIALMEAEGRTETARLLRKKGALDAASRIAAGESDWGFDPELEREIAEIFYDAARGRVISA